MIDHIGADGRLKGNHIRHHQKKGILKAGCKFCVQLGAAEKPLEPVVRPLVIEKAPETAPPINTIPAGYQEDSLAEAKRERFKDDVWSYAANGLPGELTAKLLNCSRDRFDSEVESLFHQSYEEVCVLAQLAAVSDLQTAALRNAKRGDFRAMLALQKEGLIPALSFARRYMGEEATELRKMTDDQLVDRIKKVTGRRGLDIERMMQQSEELQGARLIEAVEPSPSELEQVSGGGVMFVSSSSVEPQTLDAGPKGESLVQTPPPPKPVQVPTQVASVVSEHEDHQVNQPVDPRIARLEMLKTLHTGPVIATTDQAWGLLPHERQYSR